MTLDALAVMVVTVQADDLPGLGQIHAALTGLFQGEPEDSAARGLLARAMQCVECVILREPDAQERFQELSRIVESLQNQRDGNIPLPRPPGSATADSDVGNLAPPPSAATEPVPPAAARPVETAVPATLEGLAADPSLLAEFVAESLDHVTAAEAALLTLETEPDNSEAVNAVFRAFHTIKGTSGFLNLSDIQQLAHWAETLLDRVRSGQIRLTGGYADLALGSADGLRRMIQAVASGQPTVPPSSRRDVDDLLGWLAEPEKSGFGESRSEAPPPPRVGDLLVSTGKVQREQVEAVAGQQPGKPIGQSLVEAGVASAGDVAQALRAQKKLAGGEVGDNTVRVSTQRLDGLINLVGELVITQSMISQGSRSGQRDSQGFARTVSQMSKITRELQDLSMSLRMVPLKSTFQKMARLVRDLARKSNKQVQLVTEGDDTEIDRGMVESLNDPLVHLVRNAVDHGIETPDVRAAGGKDPCGTVTLRAYHTAGSVVIELRDDGRGLDRERIRNKAVERGLIAPDADLSDAEVFKLIFAAGFSTADQVTDVSGRGVGMDVVRRNVEALRGRVDIATTPGRGTTFSLRVPLTLAIIDGMVIRVGQDRYVLPTVNVRQAFRAAAGAVQTVTGRGEMAEFRGGLLPVFRLHGLFGVAFAAQDETLLVVVEDAAQQCALAVDELLGQQQVVIKSLGEGLGSVPGVSGAAILGDGRVGLILDVEGLVRLATSGGGVSPAGHSRTGEMAA